MLVLLKYTCRYLSNVYLLSGLLLFPVGVDVSGRIFSDGTGSVLYMLSSWQKLFSMLSKNHWIETQCTFHFLAHSYFWPVERIQTLLHNVHVKGYITRDKFLMFLFTLGNHIPCGKYKNKMTWRTPAHNNTTQILSWGCSLLEYTWSRVRSTGQVCL